MSAPLRWIAGGGLALLLLSGCLTVHEHRARHVDVRFATLDSETQVRLLGGQLLPEDPAFAAYVALGTPQYAYYTDEAETDWIWVYWGVVHPDDRGEVHSEAPPRLYTRADMRLPKAGEERVELRLVFEAESLVDWNLGPIDIEASSTHQVLPLGTLPWNPPPKPTPGSLPEPIF